MSKKRRPKLEAVDSGAEISRTEQYVQEAAETEAARFMEQCDLLRSRCESPIEELLICALFAYSRICHEPGIFFYGTDSLPDYPDFDESAFVYQQVCIGQYRADFVIWDATLPFNHTKPRVMVVECDGHDFHEKTKEQARRDKQRDRHFQSRGYKVLRFTGSEIWADPDACAEEIADHFASNDYWRNRGE